MKNAISALIAFTVLAMSATLAFAEPVAVIVNSANTQALNKDDVKNIYSDQVITWADGAKIAVYNLPIAASARETFSEKILGMSAELAAAAESNRLITNTQRNPQKLKRERLVLSIVSKNPHAIGYVPKSAAANTEGIRVLFVLE